MGYGGNDNGTTRFREYHGEYYGVDDAKIKPILKEYTDAAHLLKPNHWYEVKIRVENGATTYAMDGEGAFQLTGCRWQRRRLFRLTVCGRTTYVLQISK